MAAEVHGGRAKCLQRLIRLDMPVPTTVALSFDAVRRIAHGWTPDMEALLAPFGEDPLLSVRPSSLDPDWGGPGAVLNIGMNGVRHKTLAAQIGDAAATALYLRFIQSYAVNVARLDAEPFRHAEGDLDAMLAAYEEETDEPFPQDPAQQLSEVLRFMARAWDGTTARILREAKGAPADAGLGLVVQAMALGVGAPESGAGVIQFADEATGAPQIKGRYKSQSQGRDALKGNGAIYLTKDARGPSLEELCPAIYADLVRFGTLARQKLREEMQIEFTIENDALFVLDAVRVPRSSRAAVRIAVALAEDKIIPREEAILRIPPATLNDLLHRQVAPGADRDVFARGIAASPGAASGRLVFSSSEAQASAARGEPSVLVRRETTPEDIRGMHAASAVVTARGGITSHAAVIGRGLGLPCIVGVSALAIDPKSRTVTASGQVLAEGDLVTVDGHTGELLVGQPEMVEPALGEAFQTLLDWADAVRDIGVRANADTPADAETARIFNAEGIGLCRTEHMFFEGERLTVMREMIFAESPADRAAALDRLLPMQRADFADLFKIMRGLPVCIRLFDPPLHEFLPTDKAGLRELAEALDRPLSDVTHRAREMSEYNPMLGLRGVRLGITVPEIYDMQARAIFEAAADVARHGDPVIPEIMIPLVSARREVELVRGRMDAVAAAVRAEKRAEIPYKLGVMVETPRAALRAGDIAESTTFLSFGTNDLTQMTYGLSRDDAGRFMSDYVQKGVYREDPFHTLDLEGVGELLAMGAERGRAMRPDIVLSVCGEHGGSQAAIAFCRAYGFDYVSCSPFRVPGARLSAARLAISERMGFAEPPLKPGKVLIYQ
ncbi:putative PEP-binding protein [Aestuariibius sp. 2305UL40-4]|uniref:putative PEP-binding protein n=1 Tax=Aestuariibius violaceus TaxID=3234132 RepID=UPI00345E7E2F